MRDVVRGGQQVKLSTVRSPLAGCAGQLGHRWGLTAGRISTTPCMNAVRHRQAMGAGSCGWRHKQQAAGAAFNKHSNGGCAAHMQAHFTGRASMHVQTCLPYCCDLQSLQPCRLSM